MVPRDGLKTISMRLTQTGGQVRNRRKNSAAPWVRLTFASTCEFNEVEAPNMRFLNFLVFIVATGFPSIAHAHWGHLGELAGHGHLIGLGALVGAAALAAALRKPKREQEEPEEEIDAEGEAA